LQFPANTEDQILVGEMLEKLGSKKSKFIVGVVSEYIKAHTIASGEGENAPAQSGNPIGLTEADVISIVKRYMPSNAPTQKIQGPEVQADAPEDDGIGAMLDSLGVFTQ